MVYQRIVNWLFPGWEIYDALHGDWKNKHNEVIGVVAYKIFYSKRLNKYKMTIHGDEAIYHPMYKIAIKKVNQLNETRSIQ